MINEVFSLTSVVLDKTPFTEQLCVLTHFPRPQGYLNRGEGTLAAPAIRITIDVDEAGNERINYYYYPRLWENSLDDERLGAHQQQVGETEDHQGDIHHHDRS